MKLLFLDDDETRHTHMYKMLEGKSYDYTAVRTVDEFEQALEKWGKPIPYDIIFLDHDLGGKSFVDSEGPDPTGYQAALLITKLPVELRPKQVIVHSYNSVGAQAIDRVLTQAGIRSILSPFGAWQLA